jgi:hypothetical protein
MRGRLIIALALIAVGLVWIGQGLGSLGGSSFMVGDLRWAGLGAVAVIVGAGIAVSAWRRPEA